jgi:hypothetical protein
VQKKAYQYLIKKDAKGKLSIALLDLYDARMVIDEMANSKRTTSKKERYYLFSGEALIACSDPNALPLNEEELRPISLISKLFCASPELTGQDKDYLQHSQQAEEFVAFAKKLQTIWPHLASFTSKCESCLAHS